MGKDFADKAVPVKLHYRKGKDKPSATLDIATSAANATMLVYQKGVILERINRIFGDDWIKDVKFVASELQEGPLTKKKHIAPLTGGEKKYLSQVLDNIEDQDIKERLETLGKAILTDLK